MTLVAMAVAPAVLSVLVTAVMAAIVPEKVAALAVTVVAPYHCLWKVKETHRRPYKVMECHGMSWKVMCRILLFLHYIIMVHSQQFG